IIMTTVKPLTAALIAGGVLVSSAGAFSLRPAWFKHDDQKVAANAVAPSTQAAPAATTAGAAVVPAAPVPLVAGPAVPNYRAIVKQAGPAVVGVTVEGVQKPSDMGDNNARLPPGLEDDPFFQFFRGLPGLGQ